MRIMISLLFSLMLLSCGQDAGERGSAQSNSGTMKNDLPPIEVMKKFLEADSVDSRDRFQYVLPPEWAAPGWESGWDFRVLINGYEIAAVQEQEDLASIQVQYDIIGTLSSDCGRTKAGAVDTAMFEDIPAAFRDDEYYSEIVEFTLQKNEKGLWLINGPAIPPHVLKDIEIKALEKAVAAYEDPSVPSLQKDDKVWYQCAKEALEKLKSFSDSE